MATGRPRSARALDHHMSRPDSQLMLDAAVEAFGTNGFHAASMADIARAAGTTKPTLYARFGDKDGLLDKALEYESTVLLEHLFSTYEWGVGRPLSAQVTSDVRAIFDYARERPCGFHLLFGPYANSRVWEVRTDVIERIEARIVDVFARWRGSRQESVAPTARPTVTTLAALSVSAALRGAAAALITPEDEQHIIDTTVAFILGALRAVPLPTSDVAGR